MTLRQFIHVLVLSTVELTSILIPSYRLRVTALLSSGCRGTVESLSSVRSSSTVAELPRWMPIARAMSAKFKAFSFPVIKVISLSRYSVIPYSAFYSVPIACHKPYCHCFDVCCTEVVLYFVVQLAISLLARLIQRALCPS